MEGNKLMVGDYVKYIPTGRFIRIAGLIKHYLHGYTIYAYTGTYNQLQSFSSDYVEPIPITEEFLLKNGFCSKHNDLYYLGSGWYLDVEGSAIGEFNDAYESPKFIEQFTVKYVHELQHLLRMMGEEKEVNV